MKTLRLLVPAAVLTSALATIGCGSSAPAVYAVRGRVVDAAGKPAAGALIVFHPVNGAAATDKVAPKPVATVAEDGTFSLTTYVQNDGAPAGDYAVTITWIRPKKTPLDREGPDLLEGRYADAQKSQIRFVVEKKAQNEVPEIRLQ
jgi:hypothetical protein